MKREWFDGKRLSTDQQDALVVRMKNESECRSTSTGDTLVTCEMGHFVVWRQDYAVALTPGEREARPWIDVES